MEGVRAGGRQAALSFSEKKCGVSAVIHFCGFKIRSKDHDDSVASGAFNQSAVGSIHVDV